MSARGGGAIGRFCAVSLCFYATFAHGEALLTATGATGETPLTQFELEHSHHEWRLRVASTDPRGPWMCVVEGRRHVIIDLHGRLVAALSLAPKWRVLVHCAGDAQNRTTRVDLAERKHGLRITTIQK